MKERGFSRPAGAHQGDKLARGNAQVDAVQDGDFEAILEIGLSDPDQFDIGGAHWRDYTRWVTLDRPIREPRLRSGVHWQVDMPSERRRTMLGRYSLLTSEKSMRHRVLALGIAGSLCGIGLLVGCPAIPPVPSEQGDGPIAEGVSAPLGEPIPTATAEQLATFERGKAVLARRFDLRDGLGPVFNVVSCQACHERPVAGGSAALYRNFFLTGRLDNDGKFLPGQSAGMAGGVIRVFSYDPSVAPRPPIPDETTIFAQRNSIPMFGVGLIAQIPEPSILAHADPDDADGDGISGRPNYDQGFVGRFGRKCQTVSIEAFIRGPLFNHLGVTTVPLSDDQRRRLPVDSTKTEAALAANLGGARKIDGHTQAAAPAVANKDADAAPDPELSQEDLFDLVSFSMLLAAPKFDEPTDQSEAGRLLFHAANCSACHVPRLDSPKGPIPLYSDLLLHDMGSELADGIVQGVATGTEFRSQPLWGIAADGPFLHDGRADSLEQAILLHGGEAQVSRDAFAAFSDGERASVIEFLRSLGGREQHSEGLLPPDAPVPSVGEYGGPVQELDADSLAKFTRGRALFDRDFGHSAGVGGLQGANHDPRFNGDSCRACHFDPVIGGAGPRDVNVMREGMIRADGTFAAPLTTANTILHKEVRIGSAPAEPENGINMFELRQTPHIFGLGLVDAISEATIAANADPDDANGDGISGRTHVLSDGRIGRFGWKAQVPSAAEFVRDAVGSELGLTMSGQTGLTFGITSDDDGVIDPEFSLSQADDLLFFLTNLGPPPRAPESDASAVMRGQAIFSQIGCDRCHIPVLASARGDVPLYSDLLLHEILAEGSPGIADGDAGMREFRTAPLWGLSRTAPYFHSGVADTIDEAIRLHDGEALDIRTSYTQLSAEDRAALLAFLGTL